MGNINKARKFLKMMRELDPLLATVIPKIQAEAAQNPVARTFFLTSSSN